MPELSGGAPTGDAAHTLVWGLPLESGGSLASRLSAQETPHSLVAPVVWALPTPSLGNQNILPRKQKEEAVGLSGESRQGSQGAAERSRLGLAADGVGTWKLRGLGFSCVAWSKLLNISELPRAEHRGERSCPASEQDPGRAPSCHIMGPS